MFVARHRAFALAALAAATAATSALAGANAQGKKEAKPAAPGCSIPTDKPDEVKDAASQVGYAQINTKVDVQKKALAKAVEKLSLRPDHYKDNMLGYQYTLGQALVLWATVPGQPAVVKRGDIGFLGDKELTVDPLVLADSLFTLVEKAQPDCAEQVAAYRQLPWPKLINQVGPLINAEKLDSAQTVLDRSMVIYRGSAYPHYFQALISGQRHDYAKAGQEAEKAAQLAALESLKDTSTAELAQHSSFLAAYYTKRAADTLSGPAHAAGMRQAAALFQAYLKDFPCGPNAESAERGLFESLHAADDTAGIRAQVQQMVNETRPCTDLWWYNAADQAAAAGALPLAATMADKAVANSPWSVGLGMAAQAYWKAQQFGKMLPIAKRLTELAPNSADAFQLLAIAYEGLAKGAATPALKKAYGDSLVLAYTAGERLTVKVRVTEFTSTGATRLLVGNATLADTAPAAAQQKKGAKGAKGAAAKPPASASKPAPRPITITVEFLNRAGAVVTTQAATLTANADTSTEFRLEAKDNSIVGYRYAPVR